MRLAVVRVGIAPFILMAATVASLAQASATPTAVFTVSCTSEEYVMHSIALHQGI